jgi:hypothetical protein
MSSLLSKLIDVHLSEESIADAQHSADQRSLRVVSAFLKDERLVALGFDFLSGVSTVTGVERYTIGIWRGSKMVASLIFFVDGGVIASRSVPYSEAIPSEKSCWSDALLAHDYIKVQQTIAQFVFDTLQEQGYRKAV